MKLRGWDPHSKTEVAETRRRQALAAASLVHVAPINVADSTQIVNVSAATPFDVSYTVPRGLLEKGGAARVYAAGKFSAAAGAKLTLAVKLAGVTVASTGLVEIVDPVTDGGWSLHVTLVCRKAGPTAEVIAHLDGRIGGLVVTVPASAPTVVDANTELQLLVVATWDAASMSNAATLQTLLPLHL
jgi:hypothetical protein